MGGGLAAICVGDREAKLARQGQTICVGGRRK
jgi:hypothetical protein